jgi:hypothetical protein
VQFIQDRILVPERVFWTRNATARPRDGICVDNHMQGV